MLPKEVCSAFPHLCWTEIVKDRIEAFRETQEKILDHSKPIVDHFVLLCVGMFLYCPKLVSCKQIFCNLFVVFFNCKKCCLNSLDFKKRSAPVLNVTSCPYIFTCERHVTNQERHHNQDQLQHRLFFLSQPLRPCFSRLTVTYVRSDAGSNESAHDNHSSCRSVQEHRIANFLVNFVLVVPANTSFLSGLLGRIN